jgi:hypothetical protein
MFENRSVLRVLFESGVDEVYLFEASVYGQCSPANDVREHDIKHFNGTVRYWMREAYGDI